MAAALLVHNDSAPAADAMTFSVRTVHLQLSAQKPAASLPATSTPLMAPQSARLRRAAAHPS